jgi:hypothetical protein
VSIIGFIKSLFEKKGVKTPEEINLESGLEKWKDMKNVSPVHCDSLGFFGLMRLIHTSIKPLETSVFTLLMTATGA